MRSYLKRGFSIFILFLSAKLLFPQVPAGYYNTASGLSGAALKQELHDIITSGHTKLSYSAVWTAYASTDVLPSPDNTTIWDMYTDIPSSSPVYTFTISTDQCGTYSTEGDCYNREHSMPKSWWGGFDNSANPQYTDLNHLFATDGYVNNKRSNYPFGVVTSPTYTSSNGSKLGPNTYSGGYTGIVFEPLDDFKGDFARAYFYMATRYKDEIAGWVTNYGGSTDVDVVFNSSGDFNTWYLNMLLEWHNNDPVSQKELDRNDAVYNAQGNANPYIDHPEYVCSVWGGSCGTSPSIQNISHTPTNPTASDAVSVSADITDDVSVSSAFLYWGTDGSTFPNSISMTVGTVPSYSISSNIPSQTSGTTVYYKITATDNDSQSTTSSTYSYTIPKPEPTNHATSFSIQTVSSSSIGLNWTDASSGTLPDAYLVKASTVNYADITAPVDGTPENDASLVKNINQGTQTLSFTGLNASTTYYFKIFPYTNSGSNIDYKISGTIPTISSTTNAAPATSVESFDNFPETGGSYNSGTFTGLDGSTWTYTSCRGDQPIDAQTPCLAKGKSPAASVESGSISGGCGTLSFSYKKAFSTSVNIDVYINNVIVSNVTSSATTVQNSGDITVNVSGSFTLKIVQNSTSAGQVSIDDITWTPYSISCSAPTIQASNLTFSSLGQNSLTLSWTQGDGDGDVVIMNTSSTFTSPTDGSDPTANTVYTSGEQVVYNGSSNSVDITGLSGNTSYYFTVYEKNCNSSNIKFLTTNTTPGIAITPNATAGGSQQSIAFQGFESSGSDTWGFSGGTVNTSSVKTGSNGNELSNNSTLLFNNFNISGYTSVKVKIADASNGGIENTDKLEVYVALNGAGYSASPDITIQESNPSDGVYNESWTYTASGNATTTAGIPATFNGSGATGYANIEITIPDGNSSVALKIIGATNKTSEYFYIDDVEILGNSPSYSTSNTDYFRTCINGNYNAALTWQSSNDSSSWYSSSLVPDANAACVIISNNTNISQNSSLNVKDFNINSGSTFSFSSDNNTLTVSGNLTIDGSLDLIRNGSVLKLNGTASQNLSGSGSMQIYNLEIDNTSGINISNNLSINNNLTLTNGKINISGYTITIENSAINAISGFNASNYINGNLKRAVNTTGSYEFPIGSGTNYEYIKIDINSSSGMNYLTGSFSTSITGSAPNLSLNGKTITSLLDAGIWTITPDAYISANYDVTFISRGQTNGGVSSDNLTILKRDNSSSAWGLYGSFNTTDQSGSGTNPITLKRTGITSFSDFGGGIGSGPLPVELAYFNVYLLNNTVKIKWSTLSETNNQYFIIQRAGADMIFSNLFRIEGAGNSYHQIEYDKYDMNPLAGISYYRMMQVDYDGIYQLSKILTIHTGLTEAENDILSFIDFNVQHEYVQGKITNPKKNNVHIVVMDAMGKVVLQKKINNNNPASFYVPIQNLTSGLYYISAIGNSAKITRKFIKN